MQSNKQCIRVAVDRESNLYLHVEEGFLPKETWIKAIQVGNFNTWPMVNDKSENKYFLESSKTHKGQSGKQSSGYNQESFGLRTFPGTITNIIILKRHIGKGV